MALRFDAKRFGEDLTLHFRYGERGDKARVPVSGTTVTLACRGRARDIHSIMTICNHLGWDVRDFIKND